MDNGVDKNGLLRFVTSFMHYPYSLHSNGYLRVHVNLDVWGSCSIIPEGQSSVFVKKGRDGDVIIHLRIGK